jgi:ERCC4-type nuclease
MSLHGTQHPVIVVHGNLTEYSKEQRVKRKVIVNERMISSALAEVKCRYNIMIIWVEDLHSMLNIMVGLMQDIEDGKYGQPATCKPEQLIARLFNITVKQYAELTELVGTLNDIGKSNVTQLMRVKGIGEVKAKHILDLMKGVKEEKNVKRRIRGKV